MFFKLKNAQDKDMLIRVESIVSIDDYGDGVVSVGLSNGTTVFPKATIDELQFMLSNSKNVIQSFDDIEKEINWIAEYNKEMLNMEDLK